MSVDIVSSSIQSIQAQPLKFVFITLLVYFLLKWVFGFTSGSITTSLRRQARKKVETLKCSDCGRVMKEGGRLYICEECAQPFCMDCIVEVDSSRVCKNCLGSLGKTKKKEGKPTVDITPFIQPPIVQTASKVEDKEEKEEPVKEEPDIFKSELNL